MSSRDTIPAPGRGLELLTTAQMAEADRRAVTAGVPSITLMESAGRAIAAQAAKMVPRSAVIAVLSGPGNNGGDGFVAARILAQWGYDVLVSCLISREQLSGDAAIMADMWTGPLALITERPPVADLVIDAIFGAGLSRAPQDPLPALFANLTGSRVLAVDVPSGLDGSTGTPPGAALSAERTITFFRRKPAHLLMPGRAMCGVTSVVDIGLPSEVLEAIAPQTFANHPSLWRTVLPSLTRTAHKYERGHCTVISGDIEMSGAARLAARGALRAGAGLVTIATPPSALAAHAAHLNAIPLKAGQTPEHIRALMSDRRRNVIIIGPGLGTGEGARDRVLAALDNTAAVVLDADAITLAATAPDKVFNTIAQRSQPVVLTPHEGEFGRLFPTCTGSKLVRARSAAALSGAIVVLKGPDTIIADPTGRAAINENAPPTLATAGSGDVLAGFIGGLLAQDMPAWQAACTAVWLHGACANHFGPGLISEDIPEMLPSVLSLLAST